MYPIDEDPISVMVIKSLSSFYCFPGFLSAITAAGVVHVSFCGRKVSPCISSILQIMFYSRFFEITETFL